MIKLLKKYQVQFTPFNAIKEWSLSNTNNSDLLLAEDGTPYALEYIDYNISGSSNLPVVNSLCDIALEQQNTNLATVEEGLNLTNSIMYSSDPTNPDGTYKRSIYSQVKTMFYNDYRDPSKMWGINNIDFELSETKRYLADAFNLIDVPRISFGDSIIPNTVNMFIDTFDNPYTVTDDGNGNLFAGTNLFFRQQELGQFSNSFDANASSSACNWYWMITTSSVLWDPSYLSVPLTLWLRADDVSESSTTGSQISYWPDAGSFGNYFTQSVSSLQPFLVTSSLNSHSIVHFNGGGAPFNPENWMQSISGSTSITQLSLCCFAVANPYTFYGANAPSANANIIANPLSSSGGDFALGVRIPLYSGSDQYKEEWSLYNQSSSFSYNIYITSSFASQSWYIVNGNINGSSSILTVYIDGAATSSGYVSGSNYIDLHNLYIGDEITDGIPFWGDIAEILVTSQVLQSTDQEKVEGYLAWKYGLVGNLPSNHPYANAPPSASVSSSI